MLPGLLLNHAVIKLSWAASTTLAFSQEVSLHLVDFFRVAWLASVLILAHYCMATLLQKSLTSTNTR